MIPNLVQSYTQVMAWTLPALIAIVFVRLFAITHLQARTEQSWLDRLIQQHDSPRKQFSARIINIHVTPYKNH